MIDGVWMLKAAWLVGMFSAAFMDMAMAPHARLRDVFRYSGSYAAITAFFVAVLSI